VRRNQGGRPLRFSAPVQNVHLLLPGDPCPFLSRRGGQWSWVREAVVDWASTLWGIQSLASCETMPHRAIGGGAVRGFASAPFGAPEEDFFWGGVACGIEFPLHPPCRRWSQSRKLLLD
jgi:hypothetical protein